MNISNPDCGRPDATERLAVATGGAGAAPRPWPTTVCALGVGLGLALAHGGRGADFSVSPSQTPTAWHIRYGERVLLTYAFPPHRFKPCVQELAPLGGANILRDAPHDHLHHHALMYAIAANGLNFWEEVSGSGVQKAVSSPPPEVGRGADGRPQVTIRQTLHWVAPPDAFLPASPQQALLIEQRTLRLTVDEPNREVALHWQSAFQVGGKTNTVVLSGRHYFGLGLRFLQELDALADHFHSEGQPDLSGTRQDVSPHAWSAVAFDRPGAPVTVAVFDHPANARSPAVFFTMKRPFAYLSATQGLDQQPLTYRAGETFALNYLITVYPEAKPRDFLDRRGRAWSASRP